MNRVVIITGGTRGIGLATAAEFLKAGDRPVIFCRHKRHVKEALGHLASLGNPEKSLGLVGDVRIAGDVARIARQTLKHFGRVDILVNNAGTAIYKGLEDTSETEWDRILDTNLKGYFLWIRHILPIMKKQRRGIIINISSALGVAGEAKFSAYCSSKFGIIGLTQVAADEARGSRVKVYALLPWAVKTKLNSDLGLGMDPSELLAPEYVARKIFELARGKRRSGGSMKVYS